MMNPIRHRRGIMGFPSKPVASPTRAWEQAIATGSEGRRTLYLHIPFCRSHCSFCAFYFGTTSPAQQSEYVQLLNQELKDWTGRIGHAPINAVYFGGGTPSDLTPEQLKILLDTLHQRFPLSNDCEITLESRLDGLDDAKIDTAIKGGVNRFSLGVQTFDTRLRQQLGRTSDRVHILNTISQLIKRNQVSVNLDLLYGLPGQTPEALQQDLNTALDAKISGISFYRLRVHPASRLAELLASGSLPPIPAETELFQLYAQAEELLNAYGAKRLSVKHFALDPRERNLFNEISAWKVTCLPFGINASGRIGSFQFKQTNNLDAYRTAVKAGIKPLAGAGELPPDYLVASQLAGQLNSLLLVNPKSASAVAPPELIQPVQEKLYEEIAKLEADGLVTKTNYDNWKLTQFGRFQYYQVATNLMESVAPCWENK